jgi:hypothetical protein
MKYLVPVARANRAHGEQLADAVAPLGLSTRQMAVVYAAGGEGSTKTRELVLKDPMLVLRAHEASHGADKRPKTPAQQILSELGMLCGVARRLDQRIRQGDTRGLLAPEKDEVRLAFVQARGELVRLLKRLDKELQHAGPEHPSGDSAVA